MRGSQTWFLWPILSLSNTPLRSIPTPTQSDIIKEENRSSPGCSRDRPRDGAAHHTIVAARFLKLAAVTALKTPGPILASLGTFLKCFRLFAARTHHSSILPLPAPEVLTFFRVLFQVPFAINNNYLVSVLCWPLSNFRPGSPADFRPHVQLPCGHLRVTQTLQADFACSLSLVSFVEWPYHAPRGPNGAHTVFHNDLPPFPTNQSLPPDIFQIQPGSGSKLRGPSSG